MQPQSAIRSKISEASCLDAIDKAISELESLWQRASHPDFAHLLPEPGHGHRIPVLIALIEADLEVCWSAGQSRHLEAYLRRWPDLAADPQWLAELVAAECRAREGSGDPATREELCARFPPAVCGAVDLTRIQAETAGASRSGVDTSRVTELTTAGPGGADRPFREGQMFGRFRILEFVAQGGMGWVYRAYDGNPSLPRVVALKIPKFSRDRDPDLIERFLREAKAAGSLQDTNICPVYEADVIDGTYYISMPFIEGPSLQTWLEGRDLPAAAAAEMVRKLARGLAAAHVRGIIHRDVKPSNVMLSQSGEPLLMDFGLARLTSPEATGGTDACPGRHDACPSTISRDSPPDGFETAPGVALGTLPYMSPEQAQGREVDGRSDIFSLGVILYQMLTGKLPFPPQKTIEDTRRVLDEVDPIPPRRVRPDRRDVDPEIDAVCLKAIAKDPENRFASAADIAEALQRYLDRRAVRRHRTRLLGQIALAACLLFAVLGVVFFFKTGEGEVVVIFAEPNLHMTVAGGVDVVQPGQFRKRLAVGAHEIVVEKEGFQTQRRTVTIRWRGSQAEIRLEMAPLERVKLARASYLGGHGRDQVFGVAMGPQGSCALAGVTDSPKLAEARNQYPVNDSAFLARVNAQGKLAWTAYLGGRNYEAGRAAVMDQDGNTYVTGWIDISGWTASPAWKPPVDGLPAGEVGREAFVAKFSASGSLLWTQLLGGSGDDRGTAICLDSHGHVVVVGSTRSPDFRKIDQIKPQQTDVDCFVARLTAEGVIRWVRRFGGSYDEQPNGVVTDAAGDILLCGDTGSDDLPEHRNTFTGGERDAFLAKLRGKKTTGQESGGQEGAAVWSMYWGWGGYNSATGLCLDPQGEIFVAGWTNPDKSPPPQRLRRVSEKEQGSQESPSHDAFLIKCTGDGQHKWGAVIGGSDEDEARGVAVDSVGNIFLAGATRSLDFPTAGGFSRRLKGASDGFLLKLSPEGLLQYSTFVGGDGTDVLCGLGVNAAGEVTIAGWTDSTNFPLSRGSASKFSGGGFDGFYAQVVRAVGRDVPAEKPPVLASFQEARILWVQEFNQDKGPAIHRVKLLPGGKQLAAFHYTDSPLARVTRLDCRNGQLVQPELSAEISNHRVSAGGWVDKDGNLFLMSAFWGEYNLWKFDPDLKEVHWRSPVRKGLETVINVITDSDGNVYAAGYNGSSGPEGSSCIKLSPDGKPLWPLQTVRHGTGSDCYALGLDLDAAGNLYRVGNDDAHDLAHNDTSLNDCGRLLVHDAKDGKVIVDKSLREILPQPVSGKRTVGGSVFGGVLVDDTGGIWIACTMDLYSAHHTASNQERTILLKLDSKRRLLKPIDFPGAGTYVNRNALLRRKGKDSFYLAYQRRRDGAVYPALAEVSFSGETLWDHTIVKRGLDGSVSGFDADRDRIYLALGDTVNPGEKTMVLAIDARGNAEPQAP